MSSNLLSQPWSFLSIPVVWLTVALPELYKVRTLHNTQGFKFDPVQPRDNGSRFAATDGVSKELSARVRRMEGAHENGFENLPLWIGAVLAGNYAGLEQSTLNKAAILYIVARSLYDYTYINHTTGPQARLRTIFFFTGFSVPMYLYFMSWLKVYAASS